MVQIEYQTFPFPWLNQDNNFLRIFLRFPRLIQISNSSLGHLKISIVMPHVLRTSLKKLPWQTVDPPHLQLSSLQPCQTGQDYLHLAATWGAKHARSFSPKRAFRQTVWGWKHCSYLTCVAGPYPLSLRAAILNIAIENKFCLKLQHYEIYQELLLNAATCLELYEPENDGWLCRCVNVCSC